MTRPSGSRRPTKVTPDRNRRRKNRRRLLTEKLENRVVLSATIGNNIGVGDQIQNYRLAIAATAEYTSLMGGQSQALSAIQDFVDDVNVIFEEELSIHFDLVSGTNTIFTDSGSDGYTNGNVAQMLDANTGILNGVLGPEGYDIGHVFGTAVSGGQGRAGLGVVKTASRGRGASISSDPQGMAWNLLVAHEFGHQFNAEHTFNANAFASAMGNRNAATAYEPASGTTLMSYAGISGADDLQSNPDPYFHSASFEDIQSFITSTAVPDSTTPSGNAIPTVSAGSDFTIPADTPFVLTATGADTDPGDTLTYTWEQLDLGPEMSLPITDNGSSPLFRSFPPSTDTTRTFPRLIDLAAGANTASMGETLPATNRPMNFRTTVRDGNGGVNSDDMLVTVVDTGTPFGVTSPNSSVNWIGGTSQTITWNVAGTTGNGIDTANVAIDLSLDGGLSYPFNLVATTPNDGSHTLTLPNLDTNQGRVRVSGVGNVFFDLSDVDFTITSNSGNPGLTVVESAGATVVGEDGLRDGVSIDSYTIALNTAPVAAVDVTVNADGQTEVSADGINFASSVTVSRSDTSAVTIFVRGFDDAIQEGMHTGLVSHAVSASTDANYPAGPIGNPVSVTVADDELQPVVGIDFGGDAAAIPTNWSHVPNALGINLTDLVREDGFTTGIGFTMPSRSSSQGSSGSSNSIVPFHSPSLQSLFDADIRTSYPLEFTWTGLQPGEDYHLYMLVGENNGPTSNYRQEVVVDSPVPPEVFVQDTAGIGNTPLVNSGVAESARPIEADAIIAQADADGTLRVTLTDLPGDAPERALISGAAIQQVAPGTAGFNIELTDGSTTVVDAGTSDTFSVSLKTQPTGTVVVDLQSSDSGEATVSPSTLTFDASNWSSAQTVTVTGVPDGEADGPQEVRASLAVDSVNTTADEYDNVLARYVAVQARDDQSIPLVGVDFESLGGSNLAPTNWTLVTQNSISTLTLSDLIDENGDATAFDLTISAPQSLNASDVLLASNVPMHPNPLDEVAGMIYNTTSASLTWSDLVPGVEYDLWIMGAERFTQTFGQTVTIDGGGVDPAPFTMDYGAVGFNVLLVNDQVGDAAETFVDYAIRAMADSVGEITLNLEKLPTRQFLGFGAVAIQEVPPEIPDLTVNIAADEINENDGAAATTVTITRFTDTTNAMEVELSSSDTGEASVQTTATIPAGQASVTVDLDAVDEFVVDGTQTVTVTAESLRANAGGPVGLDAEYGTAGLATTGLQSSFQPPQTAFAILNDGTTIAASEGPSNAGQIRLVKHNADGTADTAFGTNGLLIVNVATNDPLPTDIVVQPDGKFIVGGEVIGATTRSFMARFNPDGSFDSSFGNAGIADLSAVGDWETQDLDLAEDGKVVAAMRENGGALFRAIRVNANGTLDTGFGSSGLAEVFITGTSYAVKSLPGGALLLAGDASGGGVVGRLNSNGTIDFTFGVSGSRNFGLSASFYQFNSINIDSLGRILIGGFADQGVGTDTDFVAARLLANGVMDTTFDSDGVTIIEITTDEDDVVSSAVLRDDDKLMLIGHTWPTAGTNQTAIVQLNTDGSVDTTFDSDGIFLYSSSGYAAQRSQGSAIRDRQLYVLSGWADDYRIGRLDIGYDILQAFDTVDVLDNDVVTFIDAGDAPSAAQTGFAGTYPVTIAEDGARHTATVPGPTLGPLVDTEVDGVHSASADADDTIGPADDEDGVTFGGVVIASSNNSSTAEVTIALQNAKPTQNRLDAWIDFNRDGDWDDTGEQIFADFDLGTTNGSQVLSFTVPQDTGTNVQSGATFSRFRVSSAGGLSSTGPAADGEVEDHPVTLVSVDPIVVDNAADESDGDFGPGDLSLREAIELANARPGADEIQFASALSASTITLSVDQLEVEDDLTIRGFVTSQLSISGNDAFRVFQTSNGVSFTLENLTVTAGQPAAAEPVGRGGAILALGDLTLQNVFVTESQTRAPLGEGGGIFQTGGTLTIDNSVIANNTTVGELNYGGGIAAVSSNVTITESTISGNRTTGETAAGAGVIVLSGDLSIDATTVSGNSTIGAGSSGGGVTIGGGNLFLTDSTISGNTTTGSGAGVAIDANGFTATISNSTLSGNSTGNRGGGIVIFGGTTNLNHSTVTDNTAPADQGSGLASFVSGGPNVVETNIFSSIIAGNTNTDVDFISFPGPAPPTSTIFSGGYNLIGNGNSIARFNGTADQTNVLNPQLGPLSNNGGPTLTHALLAGSPAINAGDTTTTLANDQRGAGFPRLVGTKVDIGAFEVPALTELSIAATDADKVEGDSGTSAFTFTVTRSGNTVGTASVEYAVTGTGVSAADGNDFGGTLPSGTVNFADGVETQLVTINVSGDADVEPDEGFAVTLSNPSSPASITTTAASGVIQNDDTAPNIPPVLLLPSAPVTFTEGQAPVLLDDAATVSDSDSSNFESGTVTLEIVSAGEADDRLTIRDEGIAAGEIGVAGNSVSFGGVVIGTFIGGEGTTPLVITFNAASSPVAAEALLRNIQFSSVSSVPSTTSRVVSAVLTDGDGGVSVGSAIEVDFDYALAFGGTEDDRALSGDSDSNGNVFIGGYFNDTIDADPGPGTVTFTEVAGSIGDAILSSYDPAGNLRWAKQIGGTSFEYVRSVAVDSLGNVYFAGGFEGTVDFDPGPGEFNLTAPDNEDFILKLDNDGNFINAIQLNVNLTEIAIDESNQLFVTGSYLRSPDVDPGAGTFNLPDTGTANGAFLVKYDPSLNFTWASTTLGNRAEIGNGIAFDSAGNVYVGGQFGGTADFDPGPGVSNETTGTDNNINAFVWKLDSAGDLVWTRTWGGPGDIGIGDEIVFDIVVDEDDNVYSTGKFGSNGTDNPGLTVDFDPGPGTFNLTSAGHDDIFVSKLTSAGDFVWATRTGDDSFDRGYSIDLDSFGNLHVGVQFLGTADFDPSSSTQNVTSNGSSDVGLWGLSPDGEYLYAHAIGGTSFDLIADLTVSPQDDLVVTGVFINTVDFDPGPNTSSLTGQGGFDGFTLKLNVESIPETQTVNVVGVLPQLSIAAADASKPEGDAGTTPFTFTVTRAGDTSGATTVDFLVTGSGTNPATADDFDGTFPSGTVSFADGEATQLLTIDVDGDFEVETDEGFTVTLSNPSSPAEVSQATALGTIENDDVLPNIAPTLTLPSSPITFNEGDAPIVIDPAATVVDSDSSDFDGGSLEISFVGGATPNDVLAIRNEGTAAGQIGISGSNVTFGGVIIGTFSGGNAGAPLSVAFGADSSPLAAQALLRNVAFENTSTNPSPNPRVVSAVVSDGDGGFSSSATTQLYLDFAVALGSGSTDSGSAIAVDDQGNVYATGAFRETMDVDPGPGVVNLSSAGSSDIFVVSYDSFGNFRWAHRFGSSRSQNSFAIAVDDAGVVQVGGAFAGTVDFDPGPGTTSLTSPTNQSSGFLLELDSSGNFVSVLDVGAVPLAIETDAVGNRYLTGQFSSERDFDPGAGVFNLDPGARVKGFVTKIGPSGSLVWAKQIGETSGTNDSTGFAVQVDGSGNVVTVGDFRGTIDFDPGAGVVNLSTPTTGFTDSDAFALKLNSDGDFLWARRWGSDGADTARDAVLDGQGNLYSVGVFDETVDFDPGAGVFNLVGQGDRDVFLSKLDAAGNFQWARSAGNSAYQFSRAVTLDELENPTVALDFAGTVDFDPSGEEENRTASGSRDVAIWKLNGAGDFVLAESFGGDQGSSAQSVRIDSSGNIYTVGNFFGTTDIDPADSIAEQSSNGSQDVFLQKLFPAALETQTINVVPSIELSIAATDADKNEGDGPGSTPFTFTVTRSGSTVGAASVNFAVTGTGANPATEADFGGAFPSGTVNFADGESTQTVTIDVTGDTFVEADQGFAVTLSNPTSPATLGTAMADGNIVNDDASVVSVVALSDAVENTADVITFEFSATNRSAESPALTVQFAVAGTATPGADYPAISPPWIEIPAGVEDVQISIDPTNDNTLEADETISVTLIDTADYDINGSLSSASGEITNDDASSLQIEDVEAIEGNNLLFSVLLLNPVQGAFTVDATITGLSATAGADFDGTPITLNFTGTGREVRRFTVATTDDDVLEGMEDVSVAIVSSNSQVGDSDTATGTIRDNDSAAVTIEDVTAVEGTGLLYTVTLDNAVADPFDVHVTFTDGAAVGGVDFDNSPLTLNFVGTAGESHQFTVPTTDDEFVEGDEAFTVNLDAVSSGPVTAGDVDERFGWRGQTVTPFYANVESDEQARAVAVAANGKSYVVGDTFEILAYNADGSIDTGFGIGGRAPLPLIGNDIVVTASGQIVVAGAKGSPNTGNDFAIARYNADGSLDPTFGNSGFATVDIGSNADQAYAVALDSNGKYVLAGNAGVGSAANRIDFAVARFNSDGSLDLSFGTDGTNRTDFQATVDRVGGIAIDAGGRIVVAGESDNQFAVVRYTPDGILDPTFDADGRVTTAVVGINDRARDVAIDSGGKIIVAGRSFVIGQSGNYSVVRYDTDGSLDATFSGDGIEVFAASTGTGEDSAFSVEIQSGDRILLAGNSVGSGNSDMTVARLTNAGVLDGTFGAGGIVRTPVGSGNDFGRDIAFDSSSRIYFAGYSVESDNDIALIRYSADGSLDATFDSDGIAKTNIGASNDRAYGTAIQDDGKILLAGQSYTGGASSHDFAVARYNSDGTLDDTFGEHGRAVIDHLGENNEGLDVTTQSDGKIIVVGNTEVGSQRDVAVVRLLPDGSLDTGFGTNGIIVTDVGTFFTTARSVKVQDDGKIVVAGYGGNGYDAVVIRYNQDGSLDNSFGAGGIVITDLGGDELFFSLAIGSDQKITVGGYTVPSLSASDFDFAVIRYNPDGTLDTSFDGDGIVTTDFGSNVRDSAFAVAVQPDGKTVAAGLTTISGGTDYALTRYNVDGSLDATFGTGGLFAFDFESSSDGANDLIVQPDGSILVAGSSYLGNSNFGLARVTPNGALDNSFGENGKLSYSFTPRYAFGSDYNYGLELLPDGSIISGGYLHEGGEDFALVKFRGAADSLVDDSDQATGTIINDDTSTITIAVSPDSILEDASGVLTYTFTRTNVSAESPVLTVDFATSGTANTDDYTTTATTSVVFAEGDATATVEIDPTADAIGEPDETVVLTVSTGAGYLVGATNAATGTILNDDDVSVVTIDVSPISVVEDGSESLVYTVTRTGDTSSALSVNFSTTGTATAGTDFTATSTGSVVIPIGASSATIAIDPAVDTFVEPDETVVLTILAGAGYNGGATTVATGTITNDDRSTISIGVDPVSIAEDADGVLTYTFTRDNVFAESPALTVTFDTTGTASAGDYVATSTTSVAFAAGASTATVEIDPIADSVVEPDETVILTLTSGTDYSIGTPTSATGTITNDDNVPIITIAVAPDSVAEDGETNLVYTLTRTGNPSGELAVNFVASGTATPGTDYPMFATASVTFAPGSPTTMVVVDPTPDNVVEGDETVTLTLANGPGYAVGTENTASGIVVDNDFAAITVENSSSVEGAAMAFTITLNNPVEGGFDATASFADGTAIGGTDFDATAQTLTFDGTAGETKTFNVATTEDAILEDHENFLVRLAATNSRVATTDLAIGTITDNDEAELTIEDASAIEGVGVEFTLTLDREVQAAFNVNVLLSPQTATGGTDFDSAGQTVNFSGSVGETRTIIVPTVDDLEIELDETFAVTLSSTNPLITTTDSAIGTILNNDFPPTVERIVYFNEDAEAERDHSPDSTGQRSIIRRVQVTFSAPVSVPLGTVSDDSFRIESASGRPLGDAVGLEVVSSVVVDGKQVVVLQFLGNEMIEPSSRSARLAPRMLVDGTYRLVVDGAPLGIDANGAGYGVAAVDEFFRLFGDSNGDGHVDSRDRADFQAYYTEGSQNSIFDFDARPNRKVKDRVEFLKRLGKRMP